MILNKLSLSNFRQFRGQQTIQFADAPQHQGNVTVLFGENGRGKTGIFRAVLFCLYGETRLSQDDDTDEKEIYLVNRPALLAAKETGDQVVNTFVELEFTHKNQRYLIKRSLNGMITGDKVIEEIDKFSLSRWNNDGNCHSWDDAREIALIINGILDKRVKEYFLFDGERIERLTKANAEQRTEISKGIRNLLNVDALEIAIKSMQRLRRDLDKELANRSTGEFASILRDIDSCEQESKEIRERLDGAENEIKLAIDEKRKIDKELEKYDDIRHLINDRSRFEKDLKDYQDIINSLLEDMKNKIGQASTLLLQDTTQNIFNRINQKKKKGDLPSEIRKDLIERILEQQECICGRHIDIGSHEFNQILNWKNRTTDANIQDSALDLWRYLSNVRNKHEDLRDTIESMLQRYGITSNDLEKTRMAIDEINKEIGDNERKDAVNLEKMREDTERRLVTLEASRLNDIEALNASRQEYERLQNERLKKEQDETFKNELSERAALVNKSLEALREVHDSFTQDIKLKIGKVASEIFSRILDIESSQILKHIVVDSNYTLQVLDMWGKPFLANISSGQRQIMSIAFIAALAKLASNEDLFEMPLFMDTPFSRLSYNHRKNLINNIPGFASQWILLATDTELGKREAELLKDSGNWGKFYVLKSYGPGETKIEEQEVLTIISFDELKDLDHEHVV